MEQQRRVKELQAAGVGPSAIASQLGVDRKTVRKYLAQDDFSPLPPVMHTGPSTRDPYGPVIQQWLAEDQRTFHKQHHTAQRIWEQLRAESEFVGSSSLVPRYVKGLRTPGPTTGTLELVWHPGECPGDFGTAEAVVDGVPQPCKYLTVSFPYSNAGYLPWFGGETAEYLLTGLQAVFARLGGVPRRGVFDNASAVGRKVADGVRLTELFQRFQAPDRFAVTLCNPYSGHEKGSVENQGGSRRRPLLVPPPVVDDGVAFNAALLDRCEADAARPHYRKLGELPGHLTPYGVELRGRRQTYEQNLFPPDGGSPLSSPRLKAGASRGHLVRKSRARPALTPRSGGDGPSAETRSRRSGN